MRRGFKLRFLWLGAATAAMIAAAGAFGVDFGEEITVDRVRFEGLESIDPAGILAAIRLGPGTVYTRGEFRIVVRDDIRRVYRLGYFDRVDAYAEVTAPGHYDIIFVVKERPRVKEVTFEGRRKVKAKALEEVIKVKAGDRLSSSNVNADVKAIKKVYYDKGYRFADVAPKITEQEGYVSVAYVITEGPKAVVKGIDIEGNRVLSDWHILNKVMKTKLDRFYNTKTLDENLLKEDFRLIEEEYAARGYVRAKVVDHKIDYRDKRSSIYITITVDEGKLYTAGDLAITGNEKYDLSVLEDKLEWQKGKPFSGKKLDAGVDRIRTHYRNNGYLFATVEATREIDDARAVVNVNVRVQEDRPARVRYIEIAGNESTRDKVIRREMRLKPGDVYKEYKLIRSLQRLHNLGYFDEIRPDIRIASREEGRVDLIVDVVEKANTVRVNFGAGYSTLDGLVGQLNLNWGNFDAGALPKIWRAKGGGQELRVASEFGRRRTQYNFGFTEPYLFDTETLGSVDVYKNDSYRSYYNDSRLGGSLGVGRPVSEYVRLTGRYKFEAVEIVSNYYDPSRLPTWVSRELGRKITSSVYGRLERDSRDDVFFPSKGSDSDVAAEVAGSVVGGDVEFWRASLGSCWYFNHVWKTVLAIRARGGYVDRYGRTREVPVYERYYLGGATSVRGYDEWEVGPRDVYGNPEGGKSMFYTNFEYRVPISKEFFHVIAFWDSGYAWRELKDINLQDLQSGVGGGIRINIPMMGMMGIDYGYGLDARSGQIHFNFGNTF